MDVIMEKGPWVALAWGLFSAASLPLGAVLGMWLKPRNVIVAAFMAFGGGALLAALTLDLVQEGIEAEFADPHVPHAIFSLAAGLILGGLLFVVLNDAVNSQGGFLRKTSTAIKHVATLKRLRLKRFIRALGKIRVFQHLPATEIRKLASFVTEKTYRPDEVLFRKGDSADRMYFILDGDIEVSKGDGAEGDPGHIARLRADDILGEIALVTGRERTATARAGTEVDVLELHKSDFEDIAGDNPHMREAVTRLAETRLLDLKDRDRASGETPVEWIEEALAALDRAGITATDEDIKKAAKEEGSGAAFGIWLGILLDGIPESLVIGASMIGSAISPSLIAGLFLSNLPEAMSSSVLMRKQGHSFRKVLWMWMSLVILVGIGAFAGNIFFEVLPDQVHIFMAGLASGSMLVMIAQTMMPEAFHQGGNVTGLATLAGFLVTILLKLWQPGVHG
jgi:CRP-like cAMP-binding protein